MFSLFSGKQAEGMHLGEAAAGGWGLILIPAPRLPPAGVCTRAPDFPRASCSERPLLPVALHTRTQRASQPHGVLWAPWPGLTC